MDPFRWLSTVAHFSPPDDLGSGAGASETVVPGAEHVEAGGTPGAGAPDTAVAGKAAEPQRQETPQESVRRALKETKDKTAGTAPAVKDKKSPPAAGAPTGDAPAKPVSGETPVGNTEPAPQGGTGAPAAWKAEEKAIWDSLPEVARQAVLRREADTAKGVQELRTKYQEIETAVAPYSATIKQHGKTPGQAVEMLFKWNMELAGPNKVQAFKALAQSFGVDLATLANAAASPQGAPGAGQTNPIPENLRPVISDLETRLKGFEENASAQQQAAAQQTWQNWSKDKTHAEKVRGLMAQLINGDLALIQAGQHQVSNTVKNGSIDMDAAYQAAIYAHPEVRALVLQEEQAARDKTARTAAEAARKAGAGLRPGAPAGARHVDAGGAPRVETVQESIKRALAEVRGG